MLWLRLVPRLFSSLIAASSSVFFNLDSCFVCVNHIVKWHILIFSWPTQPLHFVHVSDYLTVADTLWLQPMSMRHWMTVDVAMWMPLSASCFFSSGWYCRNSSPNVGKKGFFTSSSQSIPLSTAAAYERRGVMIAPWTGEMQANNTLDRRYMILTVQRQRLGA